jgi:hypothetical protein
MHAGGVDYFSMGSIYEDAHTETKEKLESQAAPDRMRLLRACPVAL